MRLPNGEFARVDPEKLNEYLLAENHPVGGPKARFFQAIGFPPAEGGRLRTEFVRLAREGDVVDETIGEYGIKYTVEGMITSPTGRRVKVRTVWIAEPDESPRLVTAYPG